MFKWNNHSYTRKQKIFCEKYLETKGHGTNSAIQADYAEKGAAVTAAMLLTKTKIQERIEYLETQRNERLGDLNITTDRVALEMARLAFYDIGNIYHGDGSLKAIHEIDEDTRRALCSVKVTKEKEYSKGARSTIRIHETLEEYKMADKAKYLEMLGRYLTMFHDKLEVDVHARAFFLPEPDVNKARQSPPGDKSMELKDAIVKVMKDEGEQKKVIEDGKE